MSGAEDSLEVGKIESRLEFLHYLKFKFQFLIFSDWFLNATLIFYDDIFQFL